MNHSIDIYAKKEYNYEYEEGKLLRATELDITLNDCEIVTGRTLVNTIRYYYDAAGQLIKKVITPAGGTAFTYNYTNAEDKDMVVKFTAGGNEITSQSEKDHFGRKTSDELQLSIGVISRQFLYQVGAYTQEHIDNKITKSTPTTQLVSQIILSNGRTIAYEYDAEERITKVVDSVEGTTTYSYDALGQLLTEKVNGTVVNSMTYDNYGDILTKNGKSYTYDSTWKDLLTSYNGQSITYDAQGNPTSYLGHTLTWEKGRQLKSFDSNTYTYNANGIRTSKTVNGVKHTYTLDGSKILWETWGSNTLISLYDNEETVCGIIYNNTPYYFLKNLQGDIIAITDTAGSVVAQYSYDAWGKCTVTSDFTTVGIANINPYRYRGYYYDAEIGMYYLQSRYYNPTVGRFINEDNTNIISVAGTSKGTNLYLYCENNPINEVDFDGNAIFTTIVKCVMGALFGLLVQLVSDLIEYLAKKYILNKKVSEQFTPTSPLGDYLGSAVAWALNTLSFRSKTAKIITPIIPVAVKHITNAFNGHFKWRNFLVDLGYAILTGIISVALTRSAEKQLSKLRKYRKKNSRNLQLKATKKAIRMNLNLKITKVSITLTSLDTITILILNIICPIG